MHDGSTINVGARRELSVSTLMCACSALLRRAGSARAVAETAGAARAYVNVFGNSVFVDRSVDFRSV